MLQKIHLGEVGHGAMETWHLQGGHNRGRQNCLSEGQSVREGPWCNGRGKLTASSLSADGFPLMTGPNFQPLDGNPTVI